MIHEITPNELRYICKTGITPMNEFQTTTACECKCDAWAN